jgi:tRNA threonylcarbamoyladenosine modification (KEOPS) complex Cgi121 subunit
LRDHTLGKVSFDSHCNLRASTETYIKELALTICRLDYDWVVSAFRHTLTAALEALALKKEG